MARRPLALDHRLLLAPAMLLLAVLPGCPPAQPPLAPAGPATAPAVGGGPRAELEVAWRPGGQAVTVTLRNTGQTPIKVDRKLVLLVTITALDASGTPIHWDYGPALDRPKNAQERFVSLEPGEAAERIVDLRTGFPNFVWGWGTRFAGENSYHVPNAYVALARLPAAVMPAAIDVRYGPGGFMYEDCFRAYTGQSLLESGVYQGQLTRKAPWRR
jgi:hypothetical protein